MRIPSDDELCAAAEWLEDYEGGTDAEDEDVVRSMNRVADWLREQASKKRTRDAAKANGLKTRALRMRLDAKAHADGDRRCGREWSCGCGACRTVRAAGIKL